MHRHKVLIIAAPPIQEEIQAVLSGKYEILCLPSSEDVLSLCRKERPDLIVSELSLTEGEDTDFYELLRENEEFHIPVLAIADNDEEEIKGLRTGAEDCIRMPFIPGLFMARVERVLKNREREQGLQILAETDAMTGLLNKSTSQKVLTGVCAKGTGVLMMIDLDNFKLVNDIYGHAMGDSVLIRFAENIRDITRSNDVVGRVGGDEFIAFCHHIRDRKIIAEKTDLLNNLLMADLRELLGDDINIPLGASIGAVYVPDEGTDYLKLYKKADSALSAAKQAGKRGFFIFQGESTFIDNPFQQDKPFSLSRTHTRMILEERGGGRGAMELGTDFFQTVYRFICRILEKNLVQVTLMVVNIHPLEDGWEPDEEMLESFDTILGKSLRRYDVFTRVGKRQYLVILPEFKEEIRKSMEERLQRNWDKQMRIPVELRCDFEEVNIPRKG